MLLALLSSYALLLDPSLPRQLYHHEKVYMLLPLLASYALIRPLPPESCRASHRYAAVASRAGASISLEEREKKPTMLYTHTHIYWVHTQSEALN